MAIIDSNIREIHLNDGTIIKMNAGETTEEVVSALEAQGFEVAVM
jgi:hypothetical protein